MNQQDMSLLDHDAECIGLIRTYTEGSKDRSTGGGGTGSMIAKHQRTVLSDKDRALFFAALDAPAKPTAALREAVAMHRRLIRDVR